MVETDQQKEQIETKKPMAYICGGISLEFQKLTDISDYCYDF